MRFEMERFVKIPSGMALKNHIFGVNRSWSISSRREGNGVSGRVMRTVPALLLDTIPLKPSFEEFD